MGYTSTRESLPKPHITSLKDLFDLEGGDMPTLVENNLPSEIKETSIVLHNISED